MFLLQIVCLFGWEYAMLFGFRKGSQLHKAEFWVCSQGELGSPQMWENIIGLRSKVRYITVLSCGAQGWVERHVLRNVLIHFIKDAKVMYPVAPFAKGQNSWLRVQFFQLIQTKCSQRQIDQKWVPVMLRNPKFRSGPLYKIGSRSTQRRCWGCV